jgi:methyl-accepting chemotaxis protein
MSYAKPAERRRRYFVDATVQGALLRQAVYFWISSSALFALLILMYRVGPALLSGRQQSGAELWYHLAPYLLASAALFPLVVASANRFSNRIVGPMLRIRKALKQLADGEKPERIELREKDFYRDVAESINAIAARLGDAPSASNPARTRAVQAAREEAGAAAAPLVTSDTLVELGR